MKSRKIQAVIFIIFLLTALTSPPSCRTAVAQEVQAAVIVAEEILHFAEGLAGVYINGKWGFFDASGKQVIQPIFDEVLSFHDNYAAARINKRWGFIDKKGKFVINPNFEGARNFSEGLAPVKKGNLWGCIDEKGRLVLDYSFEDIKMFNGGLAPAKRVGKWGFIDKKGNFVLERVWLDAWEFSENLAAVKTLENLWGYINKKGKFVIEAQFDDAGSFSDGLAAVLEDTKWGYINKKGKFEINPQYDDAHFFSEKLAAVKTGDRWGYVDRKGKLAIPFTFETPGEFSGGMAAVGKDGDTIFIDSKGNRILNNIKGKPAQKNLGSNPNMGVYVDAALKQNMIIINYSSDDLITYKNTTGASLSVTVPSGTTYVDFQITSGLDGSLFYKFSNSSDMFHIWFWYARGQCSWAIFQDDGGSFAGNNNWYVSQSGKRYATSLAGPMNAYSRVSANHTVTLYRVDLATLVMVINDTDPGYAYKAPACSYWNSIY